MRADHGRAASLVLGLLLVALQTSAGRTQTADFYQGKTLRIVISTGVAGGFGEYARLLSISAGISPAARM
jgi:hypothetical protein